MKKKTNQQNEHYSMYQKKKEKKEKTTNVCRQQTILKMNKWKLFDRFYLIVFREEAVKM